MKKPEIGAALHAARLSQEKPTSLRARPETALGQNPGPEPDADGDDDVARGSEGEGLGSERGYAPRALRKKSLRTLRYPLISLQVIWGMAYF